MENSNELFTFDAETLTALQTPLRVDPNTVHIWAFELAGPASCVELCRTWLSNDECERADRFAFPHLRTRHIIAHGVLRRLLGLYTGTAPQSLQFSTGKAGKPSLQTTRPGTAAITFNLTHSETRAAVGVSVGRALGIDLEQLRSNIETLSISSHYFFGSERADIENAPAQLREATFFRYWVAKEAVLKAEGVGLGFPLDRFRVEFLRGNTAARIETLDASLLSGDWTVKVLPCETGWFGAVAAQGERWNLKLEGPVGINL